MSHHASPAEAPLPGRQGSGATFLTAPESVIQQTHPW